MGLSLPMSILAAASAYQFTRRVDLSLVLFAAFAALSLTVWADDWQLCWLNPCVWALSDDFSNFRIFRSVAWMRLTWLVALAGVWTVSYLCIRQYGKGVFGSLTRNVRRVYRPIIALALLVCSGTAYAAQPLVDSSNPDQMAMTFYEIPYVEGVVCTGRSAQVFPDTSVGSVTGTASYQFQNTSDQEQNVAFGIASECADRDRIREILTRVGLWDWISSLPAGIDSMIAEAGNTVSGGQKQRIGIARALYKGASVLFFDEATSSVDAEAESEINAFIGEMSEMDGNLTVIVIAHRQETLDSCGRVIELEKLM